MQRTNLVDGPRASYCATKHDEWVELMSSALREFIFGELKGSNVAAPRSANAEGKKTNKKTSTNKQRTLRTEGSLFRTRTSWVFYL